MRLLLLFALALSAAPALANGHGEKLPVEVKTVTVEHINYRCGHKCGWAFLGGVAVGAAVTYAIYESGDKKTAVKVKAADGGALLVATHRM